MHEVVTRYSFNLEICSYSKLKLINENLFEARSLF